MKTVVFSLNKLPPTLNEIIGVARRNRFASAALKKKWGVILEAAARKLPVSENEVYLECVWFVKNKRRDQDNVTGAQKYILDALVNIGKIKDDNLTVIKSPVIHHFVFAPSDGFSLWFRDAEAWKTRLKEDLSSPPVSPQTCQQVSLPRPSRSKTKNR